MQESGVLVLDDVRVVVEGADVLYAGAYLQVALYQLLHSRQHLLRLVIHILLLITMYQRELQLVLIQPLVEEYIR